MHSSREVLRFPSETGAVVIGLANVIIGTNLFKKVTFFRADVSRAESIPYKTRAAVAHVRSNI